MTGTMRKKWLFFFRWQIYMADLLTDKLRQKLDNKQGINLMIITFDFKDLVTPPSIKYLKSDSITAILVLGWTLFVWLVKIQRKRWKYS